LPTKFIERCVTLGTMFRENHNVGVFVGGEFANQLATIATIHIPEQAGDPRFNRF
jgi:hypothetical protein